MFFMALPSSPSIVQSATPVMDSNLSDGVVDSRLRMRMESLRRILSLLGLNNKTVLWPHGLYSVSTVVLAHLIGLDTNAQIWNAIVTLYGSKTTSRLIFYRRALHSQRKGNLSINGFLMKIKSYCDSLASCGKVISEHEHVTVILNGLPPDYESVITIIITSQVPYNVQGVTTILLDAKARQHVTIFETPSSANLVSHQSTNSVVESVSAPVYHP
ncbi:hypothetical protein Goshw_026761 [Gossypium schwendimanii]|uniref:Uncharacterized protein n=1 Tax=Gossypium schwendimanii TaxID=34291 RepID=A0A7J9KZ81_GOSSC|nr:hypothetical protein [Gossypium schwendimanii]